MDGSGPEPGGVDCTASDMACDLGACRPRVCTPNQRLCQNSDVYVCNAAGTNASIYDNCLSSEYCDTSQAPNINCQPDVCVATRPACDGEFLATCNSNGSGTENRTTDCAASNRVCDLSGSCVPSAVDIVAAESTQSFSTFAIHFVLLRVLTTRQLNQLDVQLTALGSHSLTWFLYRGNSLLGPYTRLLQVPGTASANAPYSTWAPSNVVLEQHAFYLLGVGVPGPHDVAVSRGATTVPISFGQILGRYALANSGAAPDEIRIGSGEIYDGTGVRLISGSIAE
ncbi:MAG: hypothetical protein ACOY0T_39905 [Myxococcota bacterium]